MADALKINKSLKSLHLNRSDRVRRHITPESVIHLDKALEVNNTLTKLDLSNQYIVDFTPLANALTMNKSLTSLNLNGNGYRIRQKFDGIFTLCDALIVNNTLTELDLGNNNIQDFTPLAEILKKIIL